MELDQLRAFVTVAEELHFGRAALRLGISQPQVSRRVNALEAALGVALFVRTPRHTTLTDAGAVLLGDARETLAVAQRLRERAESAARGGAGRVAVAFTWSTLGAYLAPLVAAAAERLPRVELTACQLRFVEIGPALRRGEVDLVLGRRRHAADEMAETTLREEPSMLAMADGHPLSRQATVTLEQLSATPHVALARSLAPEPYDAIGAALRERGTELRIVRHARTPSEALALVSAGIGVYRLPASAARPHPGIVFRELDGMPSAVVMIRRPEPPSPAVAAVAALAQDLFADASDTSNDGAHGLDSARSGP